jgi:hypothetical protein
LDIIDSLTILGPGVKLLTVSGNNASSVFHITGGTAKISGLTIAGGRSSVGGGINNQNVASTMNLSNCTVFGNTSTSYGGGGIWNEGTMSLVGCVVAANSAANLGAGAGIYNNFGTLRMTNCTLFANGATYLGGGGILNAGPLIVANCTIAGNTVNAAGDSGGGIYNYPFGTVQIQNSIVASNSTLSAASPDVSGVFASQGYNLIGVTNGSSSWAPFPNSGDQLGSLAAPINPKLGPLQDNGGPTFTMALLPGSSALDKGKSFGLATDQRGFGRPYDNPGVANAPGGDGSDIGAFELNPPALFIMRSAPNVVLLWSTNDTGYSLKSAAALPTAPGDWRPVPGTPAVVGSQYAVTNGPASGNKVYRLTSP